MKFKVVLDFKGKRYQVFLTLSVNFTECYIQILRLEFYNFTQKYLGKVMLRNTKQDCMFIQYSFSQY